jgi:hypothetical protein
MRSGPFVQEQPCFLLDNDPNWHAAGDAYWWVCCKLCGPVMYQTSSSPAHPETPISCLFQWSIILVDTI